MANIDEAIEAVRTGLQSFSPATKLRLLNSVNDISKVCQSHEPDFDAIKAEPKFDEFMQACMPHLMALGMDLAMGQLDKPALMEGLKGLIESVSKEGI